MKGSPTGQEGIRLAEAVDHSFSLVVACWGLAYLYGLMGELNPAVRLLERGRDSVPRVRTSPACHRASRDSWAPSMHVRNAVRRACSLLHQALTAMEALGIGASSIRCRLVHLGEACLLADRLEEALAAASRALTLARDRGERGHEAWALRLLGEIAAHPGRPDVATAEAHYGAARPWPASSACAPSSRTATSASGSSIGARATGEGAGAPDDRERRCTARWAWTSASNRRKRCDPEVAMTRVLLGTTLALALLAAPLAAEAQPSTKIPRIGFLTAVPLAVMSARTEAFRQGLPELGYVEGQTIVIEWRSAEGQPDRLPSLAAELVRLKVDVIVTGGPSATRPVKAATVTIPIVITNDSDPVANGFVASLARPGGNIRACPRFPRRYTESNSSFSRRSFRGSRAWRSLGIRPSRATLKRYERRNAPPGRSACSFNIWTSAVPTILRRHSEPHARGALTPSSR